ncbi:hypothetical protein NM74_10180 [Aeromonas hydrophila]|uniref:hypothetical protein n=1 Tax=Aeromonas hydrophila TaxID=644 RepID=UPI000536CBF1|nr:hypothetical protein [Aeromonas hydrophila]KHA56677.1 hypothetical protein NM74_10180 [Aeromonas hydrophila]
MKIAVLISWLLLLVAIPTRAIGINTMIGYADAQGEAEFIITNSEDYRQYINVAISELKVVHGEIKKTPYTRDNLSEWSLEVRPARTILEPGFKKVFSLKHSPKPGVMLLNQDKIFQVSFVPTPYFTDEDKGNAVKMSFGFSPLLIIPAKEAQPLAYEMRYQDDKVTVINKGSTFFTLYLDGCAKGTTNQARRACSADATVLAGRKLDVVLPLNMQAQTILKAKMASHGNKYKAETILHKKP